MRLFPTVSRQLAGVAAEKWIALPAIILIDGMILLILALDALQYFGVLG
jgi:hypothetical protein